MSKSNNTDLSEIKNKTTLLQELQFANQIKEPEILFSKDSTILYVYIDKNRSNTFDGFLGFGTNEETSNLELNGYLNLELINNLNPATAMQWGPGVTLGPPGSSCGEITASVHSRTVCDG